MFYKNLVKEVYESLETSDKGLSSTEAKNRLKKCGYNELVEKKKESNFKKFLNQFNDPMIIILILSAIVAFIVSIINNESFTDSIVIILIVVINAIMGYMQEQKADKALDALKKMQVTHVKVLRDGSLKIIDSRELVPGDILSLEAGDIVPADGRIIKCSSLKINESSLTGESVPVNKHNKKISEAPLSERFNMVYSGTIVSYGTALVVVTNTGMDTEFGKIAAMLNRENIEITPLQKKIEEISKALSIIILFIIGIMFILGLVKGLKILEILMLSLSLAVAAIPEGLPAVITITLSLGISSMAKKKAIIRKMPSVETLGCTEIICSDKTGTITQNIMTVEQIYYNEKDFFNTNPDDFLLGMMVLNNDVSFNDDGYIGDPTEVALYEYAKKFIDVEKVREKYQRVDDIPFDSERKMMSTLNINDNGYILICKGSFESVISRCSKVFVNGKVKKITNDIKESLIGKEKELSSKSYRILAFAYHDFKDKPATLKEEDLVFSGLVCMMDPPREDVVDAIRVCKMAHIRPIMITGDSLGIGIAIAKKTGILKDDSEAVLGSELEKYSQEELKEVVKKYSVYARVTPAQKLMIVDAWQANGKVVAMTGDGVNDAPAIKEADIGIGMGITGTEVSKNVSDIILSDDSFSTIVAAVREGRRIYDNIRNVLVYLLSGNLAEILVVFIPMLMGLEIFLPIHLLYINLITDSLPAIALAFEKEAPNIMERNIRSNDSKFFTTFMIGKIGLSAALKTMATLFVYVVNLKLFDVKIATTASFLTLILLEMVYAYSCRNLKEPLIRYHFFENNMLNKSMLVLMAVNLIIFFTPVSSIFGVSSLNIVQIGYVLIIVVVVFLIDELTKDMVSERLKD